MIAFYLQLGMELCDVLGLNTTVRLRLGDHWFLPFKIGCNCRNMASRLIAPMAVTVTQTITSSLQGHKAQVEPT